jgi:hypothetical protein
MELSSFPVSESQMRTLPLARAVASQRPSGAIFTADIPSGLNLVAETGEVARRSFRLGRVLVHSQMRGFPHSPLVTSHLPSGEIAKIFTLP